jgi:hypothetical protein
MLGTLSLTALATRSEDTPHVRRCDLRPGDRLIVFTRNSSYVIVSTGDGSYQVSGGWFDRNGISPATVSIAGCTFGGSAICTDLVAAKGLFLEFGGRITTTRIRRFRLIPSTESSVVH